MSLCTGSCNIYYFTAPKVKYVDGNKGAKIIRKFFSRSVCFIPECGILYIKLPSMNTKLNKFYKESIIKEGKGKDICAVVVDIRNNGGGSDHVWYNIVKMLVSEKKAMSSIFAYKDTPMGKKLARNCFGDFFKHFKSEKIPYLNNQKMFVKLLGTDIKPDENSLKLECPVYLLCKRAYSSSGSFMMFANLHKQFITVGPKNSFPIGAGNGPSYFVLPNSRIIFQLNAIVDLMNSSKTKDVFHVATNVEIEDAPLYSLLRKNICKIPDNLNDVPKINWLRMNIDPFFMKVVELIKDKKNK
jgi:hypothetical protein